MSTLAALTEVRTALVAVAPAYVRQAEESTPNEPRYFALDLVTLTPGYAIGSNEARYDRVSVQVGAWAKTVGASLELSEAGRAVLEPLAWEVMSAVSQQGGGYRGTITTYRKQF